MCPLNFTMPGWPTSHLNSSKKCFAWLFFKADLWIGHMDLASIWNVIIFPLPSTSHHVTSMFVFCSAVLPGTQHPPASSQIQLPLDQRDNRIYYLIKWHKRGAGTWGKCCEGILSSLPFYAVRFTQLPWPLGARYFLRFCRKGSITIPTWSRHEIGLACVQCPGSKTKLHCLWGGVSLLPQFAHLWH